MTGELDDTDLDPDVVEAMLRQSGGAHPGAGRYDPMDRYRDFRAVFLATPTGLKVLHEIMGWARLFRSSAWPHFDNNRTNFHEGERNLALRILATINKEPTERPERAHSDERESR